MSTEIQTSIKYLQDGVEFTIPRCELHRIFCKSTMGIVCLELKDGTVIETDNSFMELAEQWCTK
jgi:hypothetical protein